MFKTVIIFFLVLGCSFAAFGEESVVLKADTVLTGKGLCLTPGMVLIQNGKITSVREKVDLPKGCKVVDFGDRVICPGFVDLLTGLGAEKDLVERVDAIQPDARAVEVFDPSDKDFCDALSNGITTAFIVPEPTDVISGCAAAVKTWGTVKKDRIVTECGPMVMTVSSSCFRGDRYPSSRMGAVDLLARTLKEKGFPRRSPGRVFFIADGSVDIRTAGLFSETFNLSLSVIAGTGIDKVVDVLQSGSGMALIMGPYDFTSSERILRQAAAVAEAKIPLAFTSRSPAWNPAHLRLTAALAVREGLGRETALAAITSVAASLGGVGNKVGSLAAGLDGDVAVFTGHPLDLSSSLTAVYVDGRLAYKDTKEMAFK